MVAREIIHRINTKNENDKQSVAKINEAATHLSVPNGLLSTDDELLKSSWCSGKGAHYRHCKEVASAYL